MTEFVFAYMTTPDEETAKTIAHTLVKNRMAGCVNIIPGMISTYRWRDAVETANEFVVIAKTRATTMPCLVRTVREIHPDDTPCVVALPLSVGLGNKDFLNWLEAETADPSR